MIVARSRAHVTALAVERGGSGDPSPWTALGVHVAIARRLRARLRHADLDGRTIAVVGLGHVGGALARGLAAAGARLVVADVDERKRALADELGADWVDPEAALRADVDVLAPCALGAVLDAETVPALRAARSPAPPTTSSPTSGVAAAAAERGILWAPDFVANAGGIVNIAVELEPEGYAPSAPRAACARSATRCARSSTRRTPPAPRRWPPLWRWPNRPPGRGQRPSAGSFSRCAPPA